MAEQKQNPPLDSDSAKNVEMLVACCWVIEEDLEWDPAKVRRIAEFISAECDRKDKDRTQAALNIIADIHAGLLKRLAN